MPRLLSTILLIGIIVPTFVGILPTKSNAQFELPSRCQELLDNGVINEVNNLEREITINQNHVSFLEQQIGLAQEALVYLGRANDLPVVMENIAGGMGGSVQVDRNNAQRNQLRNQARELAEEINTNFESEQIQTTQTYFGYYISWGPTRRLDHNELEEEIRIALTRMQGSLLEARDNSTVAQICQEQLKPEPDQNTLNQLEERLSSDRENQTQNYDQQQELLEAQGERLRTLEQSYSNCSVWTTSGLKDCVRDLIGIIFDILTSLATFILYTAQTIFNYVLKVSILDFKSLIDGSGDSSNSSIQGNGFAVKTLWGVARDLANMLVIFVLLYIAGATILQLTNIDTKKSLTTLIVVALLINFSGVFTRIAIDASNLTALVFYNQLKSTNETEPNIAGAIIKNAKLDEILKAPSTPGINTADSMLGQVSKGLGTFIVLILMSWVLILSAGFFIVRMVSLILLIIVSPLAFIGFVIPMIKKKVTTPWIEELTKQLTFAPVFMIMLYFTVTLSNSAQTIRFSNTSNEIIGYSIIYTIIIMMMFATLQVARGSAKGVASSKFSSAGWVGATAGGAVIGWAGAKVPGRLAQKYVDSGKKIPYLRGLDQLAAKQMATRTWNPTNLVKGIDKTLENIKSGKGFSGKGGEFTNRSFSQIQKDNKEKAKEKADDFKKQIKLIEQGEGGAAAAAKFIAEMKNKDEQKALYESLSTSDRAKYEVSAKNGGTDYSSTTEKFVELRQSLKEEEKVSTGKAYSSRLSSEASKKPLNDLLFLSGITEKKDKDGKRIEGRERELANDDIPTLVKGTSGKVLESLAYSDSDWLTSLLNNNEITKEFNGEQMTSLNMVKEIIGNNLWTKVQENVGENGTHPKGKDWVKKKGLIPWNSAWENANQNNNNNNNEDEDNDDDENQNNN